jgi:hypothetical protein
MSTQLSFLSSVSAFAKPFTKSAAIANKDPSLLPRSALLLSLMTCPRFLTTGLEHSRVVDELYSGVFSVTRAASSAC